MRSLLILLLVIAGEEGTDALPPDPNDAVVKEVLEAFETDDRSALEKIAGRPPQDGWRVVEGLCALGELDAAAAFAALTPGIHHRQLPGYVEQWRRLTPDRFEALVRFHRRIREGEALMRANRHADAAKNLTGLEAPPDAPATFSVRIAGVRGLCRWGSQDLKGAIPDFLAAARDAESLGWYHWEFLCVRGATYCTWLTSGTTPAMPLADRLLRVAPKSGQSWAVAVSHELLGGLLLLEGKHLRAIEHFEELLRLQPKSGANILLDTGRAYSRVGDHIRGADYMLRAVDALPPEGADVTIEILAHVELAMELHHLAEYVEAERLLRRALARSREVKRKELESRALMGLGLLHRTRGEMALALRRYEAARTSAIAARDPLAMSAAFGLIGTCLHAIGDHERAIQSQQQALFLLSFMKVPAATATIHDFLGVVHLDRGHLDKAEKAHRKALALRDKAGDLAARVSTLRQLATVLRRQGKTQEAAATLEEVRAYRRASSDRAGQAMACVALARCHREMGEEESALALLAEAEKLGESAGTSEILAYIRTERTRLLFDRGDDREACAMGRQAVAALPGLVGGYGDEQGAAARSEWSELLEIGVRSARRAGDSDSLCFFLECGRAGGMLEWLTDREALRAALLPPELQKAVASAEADVRAQKIFLDDATERGDQVARSRHRSALEAARRRLAEIAEKAQRARKAITGTSHHEVRSLQRIRQALQPDEAFVLLAHSDPDAFALVVTPGGSRTVDLGPAKNARSAALALLADRASEDAAKTLRRLLIEPLGLADDARRVFLAPEGNLSFVPYRLIVPDREIVLVPSGTILSVLAERPRGAGGAVLAIGDPDYDDPDLAPLPGSGKEAEAVGDLVLLREKATEEGFTDALRSRESWRAVHIAGHGRIDPALPQLSALLLTRGERDDGQLTALDVLRLDVPADLVVLSGCETGLGKEYRSEGIVGLTRSFLASGARSVVVSLWRVDDIPTRILMERLYELWKKDPGVPASEALRRAQEHVRAQEKWQDPKHWAGWVIWGLGRPPVAK